jgi:succinyl-diaminopimelate desuccinylase
VINIIPASASARFNIRFNDSWTLKSMEKYIRDALDSVGRAYELTITPLAAEAFLTKADSMLVPLVGAITDVTGETPAFSTGGGTSDARFLKDYCPVVEFGLVGDTLHQVDERVPVADLERLTAIYRRFLERFFAGAIAADARA